MFYNHICSLELENLEVEEIGKIRKLIQIWPKNPRTKIYFRSLASIEKERKRIKDMKLYYIIHPLSIFRMYWELAICIVLYISLFIVPLNIAFHGNYPTKAYRYDFIIILEKIELIFDFVNFCDFLITFITGYCIKDKREVIIKPKYIAKLYMKSPFFYINFLCSLPIQAGISIYAKVHPGSGVSIPWLRLFGIVKAARFCTIYIYFKNLTDVIRHFYYVHTCLRYLFIILLALHWFTCGYIFILNFIGWALYQDKTFGFTPKSYLLLYDSATIYCLALYRTVAWLMHINIDPTYSRPLDEFYVHIAEFALFIIYAIIGFIATNIFLVLIIQMVMSINSSEIKYYAIKSQLNKYMTFKDLPKNMRDRILSYYEYRFQRKYFRESTILDMLSDTLRREINLHCCRTLIESVSLLKYLPSNIISDVVSNLKHEVFLYNDIIVKAGTSGDCMYFIANGTVAVSTPTGKEVCHLQDGAYFGEIALVSKDQKRVANVIAIEICEVYRLDRRNFKSCFPPNSTFYKKIEQIAQERMQKTMLLEELHKKYILERTIKRQADFVMSISDTENKL